LRARASQEPSSMRNTQHHLPAICQCEASKTDIGFKHTMLARKTNIGIKQTMLAGIGLMQQRFFHQSFVKMFKKRLIYFNGRGRAEISRLILAYAEVYYEDKRIEFSDWLATKDKMSPPATIPILELENGDQIRQSLTIAKYLAREYGLAGANNLEMALVEQVMDVLALDIQTPMYNQITYYAGPVKGIEQTPMYLEPVPFYNKAPLYNAPHPGGPNKSLEQVKEETVQIITPSLLFVESLIKEPFVMGDKVTAADLLILVIVEQIEETVEGFFREIYFPKTMAVVKGVKAVPQIKAWMEKRPDTIV
jgi:glutathione S-transferase